MSNVALILTNLVAEALGKVPVLELVVLLPLPEDVVEGVALVLRRDAHGLVVEAAALGIKRRLLRLEEDGARVLGLELLLFELVAGEHRLLVEQVGKGLDVNVLLELEECGALEEAQN